jgi:hypothetical protein
MPSETLGYPPALCIKNSGICLAESEIRRNPFTTVGHKTRGLFLIGRVRMTEHQDSPDLGIEKDFLENCSIFPIFSQNFTNGRR